MALLTHAASCKLTPRDVTDTEANAAAIVEFFRAFAAHEADGMVACYHPDASFEDPVFGRLSRPELEHMWYMLCERGKDSQITLERHSATAEAGSAQWTAVYTFGATGRTVRNVVASTFRFRDGKIVEQTDRFDLWRWTRMALGVTGQLLGWTPHLQSSVRHKARSALQRYVRA